VGSRQTMGPLLQEAARRDLVSALDWARHGPQLRPTRVVDPASWRRSKSQPAPSYSAIAELQALRERDKAGALGALIRRLGISPQTPPALIRHLIDRLFDGPVETLLILDLFDPMEVYGLTSDERILRRFYLVDGELVDDPGPPPMASGVDFKWEVKW